MRDLGCERLKETERKTESRCSREKRERDERNREKRGRQVLVSMRCTWVRVEVHTVCRALEW